VTFDEALQLIRPGDFVDILSIDGEGRSSSVLLQRVLVLAAGLETTIQRSTDTRPALRSTLLTVSVSLQEAQVLGLALTIGRLMVVVRNSGDPRITEAPPDISRDDLTDATARQAMQSRRRPIRLEVGGL
jgi:Flp pilus assembly protein CpaB